MKKTIIFSMTLNWFLGLSCLFADETLKPDLTGSIRIGGTPIFYGGNYLVPISATVRNAGTDIAGRFKVNADYAGAYWVVAPFARIASTSEFMSDGYYAWNRRSIPVGRAQTLNAYVVLPKATSGKTVQFRLKLDSCVGEELMPVFCRLDELREDNNYTNTVSVTIP